MSSKLASEIGTGATTASVAMGSPMKTRTCTSVLTDKFYLHDQDFSPDEVSLLYARTQEGQAFRLAQLAGRVVLFVSVGCDESKAALYAHLFTLVNAVVIEEADNPVLKRMSSLGAKFSHIPIEIVSRTNLVEECLNHVEDYLLNQKLELSGVVTYWDDSVGLASRLADAFELPGNSIYSVDVSHDKSATRRKLGEYGFPTPNYTIIKSERDLENLDVLQFPLILKPVYGGSSIGVVKVQNRDEVAGSYMKVLEVLKECNDSQELNVLTFEDAEGDISNEAESKYHICAEEFLVGREFDVDIVLSNGEVVFCELCDDWEYEKPHFMELGSNTPTTVSRAIEDEVKQAGIDVARVLGFHTSALHIEIIYDQHKGPCLIECNPRMGGGPVRGNHFHATGVDLGVEVLLTSVGIPSNPPRLKRGEGYSCATAIFFSQKSGILQVDSEECLDFCKDHPDIHFSISCNKKGSRVTGWYDGYPTGMGRVDVRVRGSMNEAIELIEYIRSGFQSNVHRNLSPV